MKPIIYVIGSIVLNMLVMFGPAESRFPGLAASFLLLIMALAERLDGRRP